MPQDNYDPHIDLDIIRGRLTFAQRAAGFQDVVDRIRNWIDEAAWNTDQKFTDQAVAEKMIRDVPFRTRINEESGGLYDMPRKESERRHGVYTEVTPAQELQALREMVKDRNKLQTTITTLTRLLGGMESVERQMNDVRNKNTELEINNRDLYTLNQRLAEQCSNHRKFGESAHEGRQAAIDEAYNRGVREGRTEARDEYANRPRSDVEMGLKAFNTD